MIASSVIPHGPYRATKLWNEVVSLFRAGMPVKKHRQRFKLHHDCFTGFDAVEWLHALLKANPNFSPTVSRQQTVQLLNKFLKNHIIEDVHGRWGEEVFSDSGQLFRFPISSSPVKRFRQPLASCQVNENAPKNVYKLQNSSRPSSNILKDFNHQANKKLPSPKISLVKTEKLSTEQIWRSSFLTCLRRILHENSDEVGLKLDVNIGWLMHNAGSRDYSGLVMSSSQDDLPCWVLSAMKCLSNWPDNVDTDLPNYEGFEKDVFKAIVDYFQSLPEPLLTYELFEVFATAVIRCEILDQMCNDGTHSLVLKDGPSKESPVDISDRIHKQLMQAQMRHENLALRKQRSQRKKLFSDEGPRHCTSRDVKSESCAEMGLDFNSCRSDKFSFPSFTASIESLPALNEGNIRENYRNLKRPCTFKSEGNLLGLRESPNLEETEELFSSVEDLLLNMSITAPADAVRNNQDVKPNYHSQHELLKREETSSQHYTTKNRLMQLDGLASRPRLSRSPTDHIPISRPDEDFPKSESAFSVYHKMKNLNENTRVDEYATLPWHLNRRNSKVVVRSKRRDVNATSRNTWYGGEVFRSKSDIIARREVPPNVENHDDWSKLPPRPRTTKIPHVTSTASDLTSRDSGNVNEGMKYERLSKSYANLASSQSPESQPSYNRMKQKPIVHHRSMGILNEASKSTQSPLSAALNQARSKLKTIAARANNPTHVVEALQLCLLLLPPANRRRLHLLLRLMTKMLANHNLTNLDERLSIKELLIDRFTQTIICPEQPDCATKRICERVVTCLLDNAAVVIQMNEDLQKEIKEREKEQLVAESKPGHRKLKKQFTFCTQMSQSEYESHNGTPLETALTDLLHAIVNDEKISLKEKRKKLKQILKEFCGHLSLQEKLDSFINKFQKSYPHIYHAEFPLGEPLANDKKPARLGGALRKLKSLRI